jgi:hypothetical protein
MSYTLAAAATACGVNKSTILRAIKAGKVSASKDEHGEWHIEPGECHRVYPPAAERTEPAQRYAVVERRGRRGSAPAGRAARAGDRPIEGDARRHEGAAG